MARAKGNIYEWRRIVGELFEEDKPYATMKDGPDKYLFRKDGKQKLVGSADNEKCPTCDGEGEIYVGDSMMVFPCPDCKGKGHFDELEEDETDGYRYREEVDYEEDNSKIWHYVKAPGEDEWTVIDRSPYASVDRLAWDLLKNFHKLAGRWPNQAEARKLEELEHEHWKK